VALQHRGYEGRQALYRFRYIANALLNNHSFDECHIEAALAHVKDGVAEVYNKARYIQDRKNMMQWYADYLEKVDGGKVIKNI